MSRVLGSILGAAQAEADDVMLSRAFLQTPDYHTLLQSTDFNFVVGRRGTGKSALFLTLRNAFAGDSGTILLTERPSDYDMLELQAVLATVSSDYRVLRPITRLLWSIHLLIETAKKATAHYKFDKSPYEPFLTKYLQTHARNEKESGAAQCLRRLREFVEKDLTAEEIPRELAGTFELSHLTEALREALTLTQLNVVALYDRLDEAWTPEVPAVAVLGGLVKTAAECRERNFPIYPVLFIRDNMFRALAHQDDDFSRHIEGQTLRLQWDHESLFSLVTARLRVVLNVEIVENDVKVWNRFAHRELQGREGFARCLRHTLFRPRDILVLLNKAFINAQRDNRVGIIDTDVAKTALEISQHRLDDVLKEYQGVLPGLRSFVTGFKGRPVQRRFGEVVDDLQALVDTSHYSAESDQELELFNSGGDIFAALYSVGFIGIKDPTQSYRFCHDGTMSTLVDTPADAQTLVHPCYWKALDGSIAQDDEAAAININDEYSAPPTNQALDLRVQRLGRMPEELSGIPVGQAGSGLFEGWVLRAVRLLLSGQLLDAELKPNPGTALSQRDVVATNATVSSFWKRVHADYATRQVIFECKNYEEVTPDDFRQVADYLHGEYGKFAFIVRRGQSDDLTLSEEARIRALFFEHKKLIVVLPTNMLVVCIRKKRTHKRYDYTEFVLASHLNRIVRQVLSLSHVPKFKAKRVKPQRPKWTGMRRP
jgi:energy-coupling factor transporter ATP-binding protein EcfA2